METQLHAWGIGQGDRVVLVLPTGPELAVALLGVLATATVTTLNPASGPADVEADLRALRATSMIVLAGMELPALAVARQLNLQVITLTPLADSAAGLFTLSVEEHGSPRMSEAIRNDDVAFVARTSGTTSRPKVAPLTHGNLYGRSVLSSQVGGLTPADRVLILPPLYYGAGRSSLLSALVSGGSAICAYTSSPDEFFTCLAMCRPTWCSAVPATYQAILAQAPDHPEAVQQHSLRLLRTGTASMPPQVVAGLENLFQVPLVMEYGSTETGSIAHSPLPPHPRKPGSVGVVEGQDVAIMNDDGTMLPPGQVGEIVVRGPGVISGYEDDAHSDQPVFVDGWFRTGDAGYLDEDGYLFLTGRFKEMINRGGVKITPEEVENILLNHPAVADAVVFGFPHPTLGEDVGAAVVIRSENTVTERELRLFVGNLLAAFKVPRQIIFLDTIPLSAAGKVQRIGLAARLGLDGAQVMDYVAPRNPLEESLTVIWGRILGVARVGIHDNFFDLGGSSLLAAQLCTAMTEALGQLLPAATLLEAPTIVALVAWVQQTDGPFVLPTLVPLQPLGTRPPLFCVSYIGGPALGYRDLAGLLGPRQPVYALQEPVVDNGDADGRSVSTIAARYVEAIRAFQPHGPYYLAGSSSGGIVAYEMAQQFQAQGVPVGLLVLCDSICPGSIREPTRREHLQGRIQFQMRMLTARVRFHATVWTITRSQERLAYLRQRLATVRRKLVLGRSPGGLLSPHAGEARMFVHSDVVARYVPRPYAGPITLFWSSDNPLGLLGAADPRLGWRRLALGGLEIHYLPGNHSDFVYHSAYLRQTVVELQACLYRARHTKPGVSYSKHRPL